MNWKFKLSKRLALSKVAIVLTAAAALGACAADRSLTDPAAPSTPIDPAVVASIAVSPRADSVLPGDNAQLTVTVLDATGAPLAGQGVAWVSSNTSVASVSALGLVTGAAEGTAIIVASIGGKVDSAQVTVTAAAQPQQPQQPPTPSGVHAGYHVSPSGTSGGDGSAGRPWDLPTGFAGGNGRVVPGDTVWLHGGTYTGAFRVSVSGQSGRPIVFRQYPGERAIIDGAGTPGHGASILNSSGQYTEFWDFEITNTDGGRTTTVLGNGVRPNMVANYASHTKYINLVVHDGGVAFYNEPAFSDVEITGCIIYNNGWQSTDRGHGHGLYLKSDNGPVTVRDNVVFNQFGYGLHLYSNAGSGANSYMQIDGNAFFNNGTLASNSTSANILMGGENRSTGDVFTSNMTYFTPGKGGTNVKMGYGTTANGSLSVTGNYFAGGTQVMEVGYWDQATFNSNTLVGSGKMVSLLDGSIGSYSWGSSQYFLGGSSSAWTWQGLSLPLAGWVTATGLGSSDVVTSGQPSSTKVVVRPSGRQAGRANIVVYNWGGQGSVTVNLAGIVPAGVRYEIRNAQNFNGAPVATGTGGGSATISLAAVAPPTVVGMGSIAPSTGTAFHVFVVTVI